MKVINMLQGNNACLIYDFECKTLKVYVQEKQVFFSDGYTEIKMSKKEALNFLQNLQKLGIGFNIYKTKKSYKFSR